ncbi:MAG: hypothetical protein HYZ54_14010 [Ignavibacteriae bacterium]|nr:hypothetical protein [Ignavibacteriota bacterium]
MSVKGRWVITEPKPAKPLVSDERKNEVSVFFEPLILSFKKKLEEITPNKEFTYTVDIFTKWNQNCFYFCEKCVSEQVNGEEYEHEEKFVKLEYVSKNNFNFYYFRHTGKWHLVFRKITLDQCLEAILENPNFQPLL